VSGRTDAIVLTGKPPNEPVARCGPFVTNTESEIREAIEDLDAGRMGSILAVGILCSAHTQGKNSPP
jgi:hypothetical protein